MRNEKIAGDNKPRSGDDEKVQINTFAEQGIDKEPTIHIGATANALERKGVQTKRGSINRKIRSIKRALCGARYYAEINKSGNIHLQCGMEVFNSA